ncbi:MAG: calcium-binding protein [Coleofasciculaceae cyanobacterium SM2_3_26]|nr:calcium-binding protein [Coleofasciculaceae cyanobacterium SM2_3_26]
MALNASEFPGFQRFVLTAGADVFASTNLQDCLLGLEGNDILLGLGDNDFVNGNAGDDWVNGNQGFDTVRGGQGNDTVYGGMDADTVYGDLGNDQVFGDRGNDVVFGNAGADTVNGNQGDDLVYGGQDNDVVRGGRDNDQLFGDLGDDTLYGDLGRDVLVGGDGSDRFVLQVGGGGATVDAADIITDFADGRDRLLLEGGITFANLSIFQGTGFNAGNTIIQNQLTGEFLAIVQGISSGAITATDFGDVSAPPVGGTAIASVSNAVNFGGVDATNEAAIRALGGPAVTIGNTSIYIGFQQVSANNQDPRLVSFTNGVRNWYRTDYEVTNDDGTGFGLLWDGGSNLYGVFSSTGTQGTPDQDFREFATNGWLTNYGQGGGAKISIIARIDPATGNITNATYLSALLSNGNSNTLTVTGLSLNGSNLVVQAQSFFSPRRTDRTAMTNTGSDTTSPFDYEIEFTPDLRTAVRAIAPQFGA